MTIELKRYQTREVTGKKRHVREATKTVLVDDDGRKWIHVLMMDGGLVVKKVPIEDQRFMKDVSQSGRYKSMKTVIRQFREYGKTTGMTPAAKAFLTKANKAA